MPFDSKDPSRGLSREERKIQQYIRSFEKLETRKKPVSGGSGVANTNQNTPRKTILSPKRKNVTKSSLCMYQVSIIVLISDN
jgi:hypothetical protein